MKVLLLVPLYLVLQVQGQQSCQTPFNEAGRCVPVRECASIWKIITDAPRPLSQRVLQFLQNSACGQPVERKVCCRQQDLAGDSAVEPQEMHDDVSSHANLNLLDLKNCGPISSDRIAYGNETVLFEFPWMALLGYESTGTVEWKCGGTVINSRHILTAAHCVANLRRGDRLTTVRLGEYDINTDNDCMQIGNEVQCTPPVQDIRVERAIAHPAFNRPAWANDIAIVRLAQDADFTQFAVAPICLPVTKELMQMPLERVTVTGWGVTETQRKGTKLLKIDIPFVERADCERELKLRMSDGQFCAGGDGASDSCSGDSGGPSQYPASLRGTKYVQFGIVSFGAKGCGNLDAHPGVYTDVRYFLKWILDNMRP